MNIMDSNRQPGEVVERIVQVLMDLISDIPGSSEKPAEDPFTRCRTIKLVAASQAAIVSGTLSLPPGPAGLITILPELIGILKIQKQMVVDIAAAFGKQASLTREQMLYCLFKHSASQAVRGLVVKAGEKVLVKRPVLRVVQKILQKIGVKITQRIAGRFIARWVPILGSLGVGAYAFKDTSSVAETSIELFQHDIETDEGRRCGEYAYGV
jgi:hypothetical protein